MRALKMRSAVATHRKLTMTSRELSLKLILLQLQKLPKNSVLTILWLFGIWSKLERWKSLISGCLLSWPQIKKIVLKCCLLLLHTTTADHFLIGLWHVMKSGFYTTTGDNQLSGWTKKKLQSTFPKPNLNQEKRKVTVTVWWSAAHLIHYSFLNPSKTITPEKYAQWIDKMLQKLQCLQPALINNMTPLLLHDNAQLHMAQQVLQKLNALGCEVLPHLPYSPDLLPTDYHFFKHLDNFLQGKHFHNQQDAENAFQESVKSWNMDFYATRINKLISHWQEIHGDCNGSCFD